MSLLLRVETSLGRAARGTQIDRQGSGDQEIRRSGDQGIGRSGDQEIRSSGDQQFRRHRDVAVAPDDDPCGGRGGGAGDANNREEQSRVEQSKLSKVK